MEEAAAGLAQAGHVAFVSRATELYAKLPSADVHGFTQPAWLGGPEANPVNTDNMLVLGTAVGVDDALVLAVAHGNYKDAGCYLASAIAVCELHAELVKPLLAQADVAPALRRAFLKCNERITHLERLELGRRRLATAVGPRKNLRGIGASVLAIVVASGFAWIAHVGENRALIVRDGGARQLVVPHTLAYAPEERSSRNSSADDIVLRVLGCGQETLHLDVLRAPVSCGDRLIIGNAGVGAMLDESTMDWRAGAPQAVVRRFVQKSLEKLPHLPPTLLVADTLR